MTAAVGDGAVDVPPSPILDILDGTPAMSPNCWTAIEDAVRARPGCRYLEWGSGNSTLALLSGVLDDDALSGTTLTSIESDLAFSQAMLVAIVRTFRDASVNGTIRVNGIPFPKPTVPEALRQDPAVSRYEARFLKLLWYTRNDRFWVFKLRPEGSEAGWPGFIRRRVAGVRCSASFRLDRLQRALAADEPAAPAIDAGTIRAPNIPRLTGPAQVTFETDRARVEFFFVPKLQNRLGQDGLILDGLYQQLADYVSVPLPGQFDVVLVDGRARVSCLKRVHHDQLLAPGGALFLHDAYRPSHQEGLELFRPWSYIRGSGSFEVAPGERPDPPLIRSGVALHDVEFAFDRELYFYEAPSPA